MAWGECPPAVLALFEAPRVSARTSAPPLTRYAAPDGTLLLLTENGTRLMTRAAAASLLRAALLSPRPPRPRHGEPPPHPLLFSLSLCVSVRPSPLALHASHSLRKVGAWLFEYSFRFNWLFSYHDRHNKLKHYLSLMLQNSTV